MGSEVEKPLPEPNVGPTSEVTLVEGDEPGKDHNEICRQVMRLQLMEIEEVPEECAGGEAESALEVREENHPFTRPSIRHNLVTRSTPLDPGGKLARVN